MKTTCEHCIFKVLKDGVQTGCAANRIEKFSRAGQATLVNTYYEIDNYCNICRNVYWENYNGGYSKDELLNLAKKEEAVTYDILINIDNKKHEDIIYTLNKIDKIKYNKPNKILVFGELTEQNIKTSDNLPASIVKTFHISKDKFTQANKHIHLTLANYLLFLSPGVSFKIDMEWVDYQTNEKLTPLVYVNQKDCFLVSTFFYKQHAKYNNPIQVIIENYDEYGKSKS